MVAVPVNWAESEGNGLLIVRSRAWVPEELRARLKTYSPKSELGRIIKDCFKFLPAELAGELLDSITSVVVLSSTLHVVVFRGPTSDYGRPGTIEDYGVTSRRLITTTGVEFLVDAFQNSTEIENFKYHGLGTSNAAEAVGNTGLTAELTTQYNPDGTRATGTTTEGTSVQYRTVATNTLDGAATVEEHGVFSAASAGTLWDRSLTGTQTLSGGDGLQSTYTVTCSAGG